MKKNLLPVIICFILIFSLSSCGTRLTEYNPGLFEINASNYNKYLKFETAASFVESLTGIEKTFSSATDQYKFYYKITSRDETSIYPNCSFTIEFTVNDVPQTHVVSVDETGSGSGHIVLSFETTYTIKVSYKITGVNGTVYYGGGDDYEDTYIEYNNIRYQCYNTRGQSIGNVYFKEHNNTEVLYFNDTLFTASGEPVPVYNIYFINEGCHTFWEVKPLDRVEVLIIDCNIKVSALKLQSWSRLYAVYPNLKTIYIKNIVDDRTEEEKNTNPFRSPSLPTTGVDFYIGGDTEQFAAVLENTQFVNSIQDASLFDITLYDLDNTNKE